MQNRQRVVKTLAIAVLMTMIAASCGGGSDEGAAGTEGGDTPAVSFDGEDTGSDPAPIATTPPIPLATDAEDPATPVPADTAGDDADAEDPDMVDILHVNDDVVLVPTFDAPNGNQTTIFDVNTIDGIELEYPLLADTPFGNRLALLVEEFDSTGNWAKVLVPVRPNGTTAWVQTAFFTQESHDYRITIDLSENKVYVFKGDEELLPGGQTAVMGREGRETPVVRAYIDEKIPGANISPAYGDWILSIAAFSESLGTFGGGMPKLALHGTNQPELMGQYVSSGCVRIPNEVVSFIADTVPVGTIVDIVA